MKPKAFTLVEMLLSIAVIVVLTAIMAPIFVSFQTRNNVDIAAMALVRSLRRAEELSRNGEADSSWGVNVTSSSIIVFKGSSYAARDVNLDEIFTIPSNISFTGTSSMVFSKLYGLPAASSTITLTSVNNESRTVTINTKGLVDTLSTAVVADSGTSTPPSTCTGQVTITTVAGYTCNTASPYFDQCVYDLVEIGSQCWLKQNLNLGNIISGLSAYQTNNSLLEKFCYNDNSSNCLTYGGLYEWNEAMQYVTTEGAQGICPTGWHIPSEAEWSTLASYLSANGYSGVEGTALKSAASAWNGSNAVGFSALPAGDLTSSWVYAGLSTNAYLRTSTLNGGSAAWTRTLASASALISSQSDQLTVGYSVRCLRN